MELISVTCPNCGAALEIDDGIDTFYCSHCGYKILVDGLSPETIHEKSKTERLKLKQKHEQEMAKLEDEKDKRADKQSAAYFIGLSAFLIASLASIFIIPGIGSGLHGCQREGIEASIERHVQNEEYDEARKDLIKLKEQSGNSSSKKEDKKSDAEKAQDEKIVYYEQLIADKERESVAKSETKSFAPKSSKDLGGMTVDDAKKVFEAAGFKNIETVELDGSAGWFHPARQVDHIQFGGKTEFTTEDYADLDTEIIIYHFKE